MINKLDKGYKRLTFPTLLEQFFSLLVTLLWAFFVSFKSFEDNCKRFFHFRRMTKKEKASDCFMGDPPERLIAMH